MSLGSSTVNWPVPMSANEFFVQDSNVTVQLVNSETPTCWTSAFQTNQRNDGQQFKAKVQ